MTERAWFDYLGRIFTVPIEVEPTMYNGWNHKIMGDGLGPIVQAITLCGRRACPALLLREIPARGEVDCLDCIGAMDEAESG